MWYLFLLVFGLAKANAYCMDVGNSVNNGDSSLGKVILQDIKHERNDCPHGTGAQNFLDESTYLEPGESYTLQADVTMCGAAIYTRQIGAYIDFHGDGKFDASDLLGVVDCDGASTIPVSISFTVPTDAKKGDENRLRVIVMETQFNAPEMGPCVQFSFGAIKDFSITFSGGLSDGSIFLIILGVLIPLYCVLGCVYNVKKNGKTVGMDAVPQREVWCVAVPALVKEGCTFTKGKLMGLKTNTKASSGESAYDNL